MVKIIFFDIDGTLLPFGKREFPDSVIESLTKLKERDIKIVVATGRPKATMKFVTELFDFDAYMTSNGQYCFDSSEHVIFAQEIPAEDLRTLAPYVEKYVIPCNVAEEESIFMSSMNQLTTGYYNRMKKSLPDIPVKNINEALDKKIYQISPFVTAEDEYKIMSLMPHCKALRWHPIFCDIIHAAGGKGHGMKKISEYFGLEIADSIAFGDGGNDVEMFQTAGFGIAMGNSSPEVKEHAAYVTSDVDCDGVYNALRHYSII